MHLFRKNSIVLGLCILCPIVLLFLITGSLRVSAEDGAESAMIVGQAVDGRTGALLPEASAIVYAYHWDNGSSELFTTTINITKSKFALAVTPGTWRLKFGANSTEEILDGYLLKRDDINEPSWNNLESGDVITQNLILFEKDAKVTGAVTDPDGNPIGYPSLVFKGIDELEGGFIYAYPDGGGGLDVDLPHGSYMASIYIAPHSLSAEDENWFVAPAQKITLGKGETLENVELSFEQSTSVFSAIVLGEGVTESHKFHIYFRDEYSRQRGSISFNLYSNGENGVGFVRLPIVDRTWHYFLASNHPDELGIRKSAGVFKVNDLKQMVIKFNNYDQSVEEFLLVDPEEKSVLESPDGTTIVLPENTLIGPEDTQMRLDNEADWLSVHENYVLLGSSYRFMEVRYPNGEQSYPINSPFQNPVTVTVPFNLENYPSISSDDLRISVSYGRNSLELYGGDWFGWDHRSALLQPISIDSENSTVTFLLEEPGTFGVVIPSDRYIDAVGFFPHTLYFPTVALD